MDKASSSVAIMQPYFFPYLGYFQLINAVDTFVIYDDVDYIKSGWINRNRILAHGKELMITLPLQGKRSFTSIKHIEISKNEKWLNKTRRTLQMAYAKAPYFDEVRELAYSILEYPSSNLSEFLTNQLQTTCKYLGIQTQFIASSTVYDNQQLERQNRLIDICKKEKATTYINALGGEELYSKDAFAMSGIQLHFLKPQLPPYQQFEDLDFTPGLSMIDVMMHNSPAQIQSMLDKYSLI